MQDLSHLLSGAGVNGGESMAATNTISEPPQFTAPGSVSESTAGIKAGTPGPVLPAENADTLTDFQTHQDAADPYHLDAGSGPWTTAPAEDVAPARGGDGPWRKV
jgi:hypothetical protein